MKWLLYIFLLANLAMFFWHYQPGLFREQEEKQQLADGEQVPQLVLLREFESQQQSQTSAAEDVQSCFNLGPFLTRKAAGQINQELKSMGISAVLRVNKDKTRPGYWVLIPPEKDRQAARKVIARLKAKNIKDYFLVATGSQKNAVSLGVFSRPELAQKRLRQIKKMGFSVSIEKVDLPRREYWLEWPTSAENGPEAAKLERWRQSYPTIGNTQKACQGQN
jgi:hypothetical protein